MTRSGPRRRRLAPLPRHVTCLLLQVPINDTNTQFVEQTIAIMKNLLDNHAEGSSEHLGQASIETMMLNLVRYLLLLPKRAEFHTAKRLQ